MTTPQHAQASHPDPGLILSFRRSLRACTKCPLHANTGGPIPWSGDTSPDIAILGEAPGKTEARQGEPFVGDSGIHLRQWLRDVGINPAKVTFLNAVACFPDRSNPTPTPFEMNACRPWLNGQLEFIRPRLLITMGNTAFNQLRYPHTWPKLQSLHGKPLFHPRYHFPVIPTYHPAAYLRGKRKKYLDFITEDLRFAATWDGTYPEVCAICGDEFYRYDNNGWGFATCRRHAMRQMNLFPEDAHV